MPARIPFLTPRERREAERCLASLGHLGSAFFFGGYPDAERVCLFLLPDYLLDALGCAPMDAPGEQVLSLLAEEVEEGVCALRVRGSGFRTLRHKDYLGSLLALGIERPEARKIGDDHGKDRAKLYDDVKHLAEFRCEGLVGREREGEKFVKQDQMPRRADGQPFCDTLDNAVDHGGDDLDEFVHDNSVVVKSVKCKVKSCGKFPHFVRKLLLNYKILLLNAGEITLKLKVITLNIF